MKKLLLSLLLISPTACTDDLTSSQQRAIIDTPCAADADCPTGFECEVEVEHGTTTSYCQADDVDGECPAGYELEVEDGQAYCKPHGGDDASGHSGGDDSTDDSGSDPTTPSSGASCAADSDCPAGEECEIEVEHGTTTGTCKPHGGV